MSEPNTMQQKQFTIVRVFDAPRSVVWRAWTDPNEAAHWWHPREVVTPRHSVRIDARVGGRYEYRMIAPDATEYPTGGEYIEVQEPERLTFTWADPGDPVEDAPVITVVLAELDGNRTEMTFTVQGVDGRPGDDYIYDGWDQAFDILVEHLH